MPPKRVPKAPPARSPAMKAPRPASTKKKQVPPKPAAKKKVSQAAQPKNQKPKPAPNKVAQQHKASLAKKANTNSGEPLSKKLRSEKTKQQHQNISETISDEDKIMTLKRLKETDRESYNARVTDFVDLLMHIGAEVNPTQPILNIFWDYLISFRKHCLAPSRCDYMDPTDIITAIALHPFCGLERKVDFVGGFRNMSRDISLGATPLIIAVIVGIPDVVAALLAAGADAMAKDDYDLTALHFAAVNEDVFCINALLSVKGIDVDAKDNAGRSPLYYAIKANQLHSVRSLLANGANPFITDVGNLICLQAAIQSDNLAIVESIVNVIGREQLHTFLGEAIQRRCEEVVAFFMRIGGDVGGNDYYMPLLHASGIGEVACARVLLDNGSELKDESLLFATENEMLVAELLAQGVSTRARDENGWTPLHHAVGYGKIQTISLLLARDTQSLNQQTWSASGQHSGLETPLHIAVFYGHPDAVEALLNKGAQTELPDGLGRTPLQMALNRNSCPIVKLLISAGANIFVTFPNGMTTLHQAAIYSEVCNAIGTLVELGLDPEVRCKKLNATPLLYAVGSNCIESVNILIDHCNANLEARDYLNRTPLLLAVGRIQYPFNFSFHRNLGVSDENVYIDHHIIEKLLDAGACIEVHDEELNTPLHIAAAKQDCSAIELLVARGANVKAENSEGKTPLQLWIESFYFDYWYDVDVFRRVVDILQR